MLGIVDRGAATIRCTSALVIFGTGALALRFADAGGFLVAGGMAAGQGS